MSAVPVRRPRGQDLVEFAVTLPVLVLLVFAILDLGRVVYYYSALQNAVREGARWGIIHPDNDAGVESVVRDRALGLDQDELDMVEIYYDYTDYPANPYDERTLTVTFEYGFNLVTPLVGRFFNFDEDDQLILTASSTMHHEY